MNNIFDDTEARELRERLIDMINQRPNDFVELKEPVGMA
jgi:hypothetical protein